MKANRHNRTANEETGFAMADVTKAVGAVPERDVAAFARAAEAVLPALNSEDYLICAELRAKEEAEPGSAPKVCLADRLRVKRIADASGTDPEEVVRDLLRVVRGRAAAERIARRAGVPLGRVLGDYLAAAKGRAVNAGRLHLDAATA